VAAACPRAGRLPYRSYLRAHAPPRRRRAGPSAGFPFCRRRRRPRKEADLLEVAAPQSSRPPPRVKEASDLRRRWPGKEEAQAQAAIPSSARPSAALPRRLFSSAGRCTPLLPFTRRCGSVPISRTEDVRRHRRVHLVDSIWLQRERGRGREKARRLECSTVGKSQECSTGGLLSQNVEGDAVTVGAGTVLFPSAKCRYGHR
jgi:hypothetical protein